MESFKIFTILCFFIASLLIRESQSTLRLLKKGLVSKRPGHNEILLPPNHKQCVCFPSTQSGISVSEKISPNGESQKRLVVYFYQKKGSNEFSAYIPNAIKQRLIPELTFDESDVIGKVDREKPFDPYRFTRYFHRIIVQLYNKPNVDTTTTHNPTKTTTRKPSNVINIRPQDQVVKIITNPNEKPLKPINKPGNQTIIINTLPIEPWDHHQHPKNLNKSHHGINEGKFTKPPSKKPNGDLNLQIKWPHKSDNKGISPQYPNKGKYDTLLHNNNKKIPNESGTKSVTILQPEWIDLTLPSNADLTLPSNAFSHPAFEQWFIKQVQNIRSSRPTIFNLVDTHTLRLLLKKSLYNNGIRQNKAGKLYDSNGNYIDMAKLVLRPMYLGDSLNYEKIIASKKCVIPYDIPYVEALLVTLVDPPKVLAIIPLRKIVISKSSNVIRPGGCNLSNGKRKCQTNKCLKYQASIVDAKDGLRSADASDEDEETKYLKIELSRTAEEDNEEVEAREALHEPDSIDDVSVWRNDESEIEGDSSRSDNDLDSDIVDERTIKEDSLENFNQEGENNNALIERMGGNKINVIHIG